MREMFKDTYIYTYYGYFESKCEEIVVPQSLIVLVSMILAGQNIKDQKYKSPAKIRAALSVVEFLMLNSVKRSRGSEFSV